MLANLSCLTYAVAQTAQAIIVLGTEMAIDGQSLSSGMYIDIPQKTLDSNTSNNQIKKQQFEKFNKKCDENNTSSQDIGA